MCTLVALDCSWEHRNDKDLEPGCLHTHPCVIWWSNLVICVQGFHRGHMCSGVIAAAALIYATAFAFSTRNATLRFDSIANVLFGIT